MKEKRIYWAVSFAIDTDKYSLILVASKPIFG